MSAGPSRIPVRIEMRPMRPAPAPVGKAVPVEARPHWSATFADAINTHVWRKEALDFYESHQFIGRPDEDRWCSRCTLQLAADWKDPKKPLPPSCGDPLILPVPAVYEYAEGNPVNGIRLADPNYSGAKIRSAKQVSAPPQMQPIPEEARDG